MKNSAKVDVNSKAVVTLASIASYTLRRYDTCKLVNEIFEFVKVFIVAKYVKIRFKNRGYHTVSQL